MAGWVIVIAVGCVVWAIVAGLSAVSYCRKHGVPVNIVLLSVETLKCLSQYRKLTRAETGHVGPLFYHYVIPINVALVLVLILIVARFT